MAKRRIYDDENHAQMVTFGCYRRRRLLDHPHARQIVIDILADQLERQDGTCCGFVIMPDHVHAILHFPVKGSLSQFMQSWKSRSSRQLKKWVRGQMRGYFENINAKEPFWHPKYYPFNLFSEKRAKEKLDYMHRNPIDAGLVEQACDWQWSSARFYMLGEPVGVPIEWVF